MSKSQRRRINLTIDPELWERCQRVGKKFGLNWSRIAEETFFNVLSQMEELEKILDSIPPELQASMAKANLRKFVEQTYGDLNQELQENTSESKSKKEE